MSWRFVQIRRFGGPEVLQISECARVPRPGIGEVRIKVLAVSASPADAFIRRGGQLDDVWTPLPLTPGCELAGVVEEAGPGAKLSEGQLVADLCVTGGYAQYAIRPAHLLVPVPDGVDPIEAACVPFAYVSAFQMLTRYRRLRPGDPVLVAGGSGCVGAALLDLGRHLGLRTIATCTARGAATVERLGAIPLAADGPDVEEAVRRLSARGGAGVGVDAAFDGMGGTSFVRSFACVSPGGLLVAYGSRTFATGAEGHVAAAVGYARLHAWRAMPRMFGGRRAALYSAIARRRARAQQFRADLASVLHLLRERAVRPAIVEHLPLNRAGEAHRRMDAGGLGGRIVLLPWAA